MSFFMGCNKVINKMSFANKTVLVTGASSGIGADTAVHFSKEGANVVIIGRNETKLKNVAIKCEKVGKKPLVIKADVSRDDEVEGMIKKTIEKFGKLDVLVNNAGFSIDGSILNGKFLEAYDSIMKVNVRAVIKATMIAAPFLIKTKGNIINISSIAATCTPPSADFIPYCVSKAALNHFSKCVAAEMATVGVRVNVVSPGPVETDFLDNSASSYSWDEMKVMTALKRVSEPCEIADLILFLASDKSQGITGSVFVCDNGFLLKNF